MHALPIKPRHIVVRSEHEKSPVEMPLHLSPKHVAASAHHLASSPPKQTSMPLETHRVETEIDAEELLASHKLPESELRQQAVGQHRITVDDEIDTGDA